MNCACSPQLRLALLWMVIGSLASLLTSCGSVSTSQQADAAPASGSRPAAPSAPSSPPSIAAPAPTSSPAPTTLPSPTSSPVPTAAPTAMPTSSPEPTAVPTSSPVPLSKPARIVIESIGLDSAPVAVGLDENNLPIVPEHDIGWYELSAMPGGGENVVFWGHVLRFLHTPDIPAPFAKLESAHVGDQIVIYTADGTAHTYAISQQVWATPDQVEYILPQGHEQLTLVSCIGDKVIVDNALEMTHRLITIALPV